MTESQPTDPDPGTAARAACVEFMRDWNILPPENCAWRMFARLKTALRRLESEDAAP